MLFLLSTEEVKYCSVGARVWVYCPICKKQGGPKVDSHWRGLGKIL